MTESEWMRCEDPGLMLEVVQGLTSDRKLRLVSVACCRSVFDSSWLDYRKEVETVEQFADGLLTVTEFDEALADLHPGVATFISADRLLEAATSATLWKEACAGASQAGIADKSNNRLLWHYTDPRYSTYIRDIFCNPFRPVTINPIWLDPTVSSLARAAYEERIMPSGELDPARLAVLSDALEEVGCDDEEILNHLRSAKPHVRGCWAVDLILGKE